MDHLRRIDRPRARTVGLILATIAACLLISVLRRPDQFLHPYVWVEEYLIINRYQNFGPVNASLYPYVGYFLWPTSFSVSLATYLSFEHLPALLYGLSMAWLLATVLLILLPRSTVGLPWRAGLAVLLVLTPTDPEVFGVLLYVFWWTSLWPLIAYLWCRDHWALRAVVLLVGGMSSIAGALFVVPYALSFLLTRRRRDLFSSVVLAACLVPQLIAYFTSSRADDAPAAGDVALQVLRNAGYYALLWLPDTQTSFLAFAGAVALLAIVVMAGLTPTIPHRHELVFLVASYLMLQVVASVPAPMLAHPVLAGPRYYFLPFAVTSWVLLLIVRASVVPWARTAGIVLLCLGALSLSRGFSREHDDVSWAGQVDRCRTEDPPFFIPVHLAGDDAVMWATELVMSPAMCERLGR